MRQIFSRQTATSCPGSSASVRCAGVASEKDTNCFGSDAIPFGLAQAFRWKNCALSRGIANARYAKCAAARRTSDTASSPPST